MVLQKQARLLEALKDIETGENDSGITLIPECLKVVESQNEIQNEMTKQWQNLERVQGTFWGLRNLAHLDSFQRSKMCVLY